MINIPEMRLYYFHPRKGRAAAARVHLSGRARARRVAHPQGQVPVQGKTKNPTWIIPESIREERIREKGRYRENDPGRRPANPLGKYRFELSMPGYRIHGTNIPWGVGMQVSHGCIRLYPEDIEKLFPMVPIGTTGEFIYQPVKIGARDGRIYAEVHKDIYTLTPGLFSEARRIVGELGWADKVDFDRLRRAVEEQSGVALDITLQSGDSVVPEEDLRVSGQKAPRPSLPDRAS